MYKVDFESVDLVLAAGIDIADDIDTVVVNGVFSASGTPRPLVEFTGVCCQHCGIFEAYRHLPGSSDCIW